jgi:hypothetical protein
MTVNTKKEMFHRVNSVLDRANEELLSGFLERDHVGAMRGIIKNSGKEKTFHRDMDQILHISGESANGF